jgi:tRNA(fMet)-specific endonuclease VapC
VSGQYLLDTNAASGIIRRRKAILTRAALLPDSATAISSVTAAELLYGLAKMPNAATLGRLVREYLRNTQVFPWTEEVAPHYGILRAILESRGITIAPLDLMIAAHALAIDATLISADKALAQIGIVKIEDWSA